MADRANKARRRAVPPGRRSAWIPPGAPTLGAPVGGMLIEGTLSGTARKVEDDDSLPGGGRDLLRAALRVDPAPAGARNSLPHERTLGVRDSPDVPRAVRDRTGPRDRPRGPPSHAQPGPPSGLERRCFPRPGRLAGPSDRGGRRSVRLPGGPGTGRALRWRASCGSPAASPVPRSPLARSGGSKPAAGRFCARAADVSYRANSHTPRRGDRVVHALREVQPGWLDEVCELRRGTRLASKPRSLRRVPGAGGRAFPSPTVARGRGGRESVPNRPFRHLAPSI
jgi:hypothetical protein